MFKKNEFGVFPIFASLILTVDLSTSASQLALRHDNVVSRAPPCLYSHQMYEMISVVPWQKFARFSAFGREIIPPKSDSFLYRYVNPFSAVLHFVKLDPKQKWPFWTSLLSSKDQLVTVRSTWSTETNSLTFLLRYVCHLPGRFGEDIVSKKYRQIYVSTTSVGRS